jgi:hypothetical protein
MGLGMISLTTEVQVDILVEEVVEGMLFTCRSLTSGNGHAGVDQLYFAT